MRDGKAIEADSTDAEANPFEKAQMAADHEDRAERLLADAVLEVEAIVGEKVPFDADVTAEYDHGRFEVTCGVPGLSDEIATAFDEDDIAVSTPLRIVIGEHEYATDRDRIRAIKDLISTVEDTHDDGAPISKVLDRSREIGLSSDRLEHEIENLKQKGEVYEPKTDTLRTT